MSHRTTPAYELRTCHCWKISSKITTFCPCLAWVNCSRAAVSLLYHRGQAVVFVSVLRTEVLLFTEVWKASSAASPFLLFLCLSILCCFVSVSLHLSVSHSTWDDGGRSPVRPEFKPMNVTVMTTMWIKACEQYVFPIEAVEDLYSDWSRDTYRDLWWQPVHLKNTLSGCCSAGDGSLCHYWHLNFRVRHVENNVNYLWCGQSWQGKELFFFLSLRWECNCTTPHSL